MHLQRVPAGQTPDQVVAERLTAKPALAKAKPSRRAGPYDITKARLIAESAEEVSQPDTKRLARTSLANTAVQMLLCSDMLASKSTKQR